MTYCSRLCRKSSYYFFVFSHKDYSRKLGIFLPYFIREWKKFLSYNTEFLY